ncbi:hypothetical protein ACFXPK_13495, partial [Streptomyces sp. NPDC059142]
IDPGDTRARGREPAVTVAAPAAPPAALPPPGADPGPGRPPEPAPQGAPGRLTVLLGGRESALPPSALAYAEGRALADLVRAE